LPRRFRDKDLPRRVCRANPTRRWWFRRWTTCMPTSSHSSHGGGGKTILRSCCYWRQGDHRHPRRHSGRKMRRRIAVQIPSDLIRVDGWQRHCRNHCDDGLVINAVVCCLLHRADRRTATTTRGEPRAWGRDIVRSSSRRRSLRPGHSLADDRRG
jgi:hypothetical protein